MLEQCPHCSAHVLFLAEDCPNCGGLKSAPSQKNIVGANQPIETNDLKEFHYITYRVLLYAILSLPFTGFYFYLAIRTLEPGFGVGAHADRGAWVIDLLNTLPVFARVGAIAAFGALHLAGGLSLFFHWRCGLAPLVLSKEGVTGFKSWSGRQTIPWDEITKLYSSYGNFHVYSKGKGNKWKGKALSVSLFLVGSNHEALAREINTFQSRLRV